MSRFSLRRLPWLTAGLSGLAVGVGVARYAPSLEFNRAAIANAGAMEVVARVLGCQWAHFGWEHLGWDLGAFVVVCLWCETWSKVRTVWALGVSAVLIPVFVGMTCPAIQSFRGLSGVDCALFALGATLLWKAGRERRDRPAMIGALVAGALAAAKVGYEVAVGDAVFAADGGFVVVPMAHVAGLVIGMLAGLVPGRVGWRVDRSGNAGGATEFT